MSRDDRVDAGTGRDNLDGGPGDDVQGKMTGGEASLYGGTGNDLLDVSGTGGRVGLAGGPGGDHYRIGADSRRMAIVEFPREGHDIVSTARSLTVPLNIEEARITTPKGARLTGTEGAQRLVGGPRDDVLDGGGGGADRLDGRAGDDRLVLGDGDFDTTRGGPGADRFLVHDEPQTGPPLEGVPGPVSPTAHRIRDLRPKDGDRLILPRSSYGPEIAQAQLQTTRSTAPQARLSGPTLLWDPARSLLRYDRDGSGPIASQLVAILEGKHKLPRQALQLG